jgi:hypothetical protein
VKIKCITSRPDNSLTNQYNEYFTLKQDFHVTIGKEYTVFGLEIYDYGLVLAEILSDYNNLVSVPLTFFTITESSSSKYWKITQKDKMITIWPELFNRQYFHDDLLDGEDEDLLKSFRLLVKVIEEEIGITKL